MNFKKQKECNEPDHRVCDDNASGHFKQQGQIRIDISDDSSDHGHNDDDRSSGITPQTASDSTGLKMHEGVNESASLYYGPGNPPDSSATSQNEVTHNVDLPMDTTVRGNGDKSE